MIIGFSTDGAAGITVFGDYNDMVGALDTLGELRERSPLTGQVEEFAAGFAHEFRKSTDGSRETMNGTSLTDPMTIYYGFCMLWPLFLVQLGVHRWTAGFGPTTRTIQADLYRLEAVAEQVLYAIDPRTGRECMDWLERFEMFSADFMPEFVAVVATRYAVETSPGKSRFMELPKYLDMMSELSNMYEDFERRVEKIKPHVLEDLDPTLFNAEFEW